MAKPKNSYLVRYERDDDGRWVASVPDVPGCHTQGRTIEQTRERIREALQVVFDLKKPFTGELHDNVVLPLRVQKKVRSASDARHQAQKADAAASAATRDAIAELVDLGLSLRDAGEMIGVTRQRAQQLTGGSYPKKTPVRRVARAEG